MKRNNKKQKIYATTVTLALTAGVAAGVSSYRSATQFQPTENSRQIRENHVSFSDQGDMADNSSSENNDNSALWEKNEQTPGQNVSDAAKEAAYLFEQLQENLNQPKNSVNIAQNEKSDENQAPDLQDQKKKPNQNPSEPVYDITDNKDKADTVIRKNDGDPSDAADQKDPGTSGTDGKNNGSETPDTDGKKEDTTTPATDGDGGNGNTGTTEKPSDPDDTKTETPDTNGNQSDKDNTDDTEKPSDSGKDTSSDTSGDNGKKDDDSGNNSQKPSRPSTSVKDPQPSKPKPGIIEWFPSEDFKEDKVTSDSVDIEVKIIEGSNTEGALYKGQSVDAYTIFCALDTFIYEKNSGKLYLWGESDYGKYLKITGVSFDGGATWTETFPVTIPENLEDGSMYLKAEYRIALTGEQSEWQEYEPVLYNPKDTKLYLLSEKLEGDEIDTSVILNADQFPELGMKINLLRYLAGYLGWDRLDALYPGWMEDGEVIPWRYEVTAGRHILEPADSVPLDPFYVAVIRYQWLEPDGSVDVDMSSMTSEYCPLQTLTGIEQDAQEDGVKYLKELTVPKYIQAVCMEEQVDTDTIQIPDTVIFVKNNGSGLRVRKAWQVDAGNANYSSENGILLNKEKTQMIGIPYEMSELTIPREIEKVNLTSDNQLQILRIEADSVDQIPEMKTENLQNCKVIVPDEILDDVLTLYGESLTGNQNCVAASSRPEITYTMKNGIVVNQDGELYKVLGYHGSSLRIPSYVTAIGPGAFQDADHVRTLIMPDEKELLLDKDSFAGSAVNKIVCRTQGQMERLAEFLNDINNTDISLYLSGKTDDGYAFFSEKIEENIVTTLTDAPEDVQEFDGTVVIDGEPVTVDVIEANTFAGCSSLKWVTLPEKTFRIGYQAFRGCSALEGILINNRDTITIGEGAFDNCNALRFVASNAPHAVMEGEYNPLICNHENYDGMTQISFFFVPQDADGYGYYANALPGEYGVDHYEIYAAGETGRILYAADGTGNNWLALRAGSTLDRQVSLPSATTEIYTYAFSGSQGTGGRFEVNWSQIYLMEIQEAAFYASGLSGDVQLGSENDTGALYLRNYAFAGCSGLNSVVIYDTLYDLGNSVFANDTELKYAEFSDAAANVEFFAGMFNGCFAMEKLVMNMSEPIDLVTYGTMKYQFNSEWTPEEEAQNLKLIVPADSISDYIMDWRYLFAGSTGAYSGDAYLDLWNDTQGELIDWFTGTFPTDEEVDAAARERLLQAENRIRQMTGTDLVSEPTAFYPYRLVGTNLTLVGVPSYTQNVELSPEVVALPEGWFLDDIAEGAFYGAAGLRNVMIPANMSGIASGMLEGAAENSSQVTLHFQGKSPLTLKGYTETNPFVFGIEEEKIKITVPSGCEKAYIKAWTYPMAGYQNKEDMESAVTWKLLEEGEEPTEENVQLKMVEQLLDVENRLRSMMGMDAAEKPEELICYSYDGEGETESETESESESESDESIADEQTKMEEYPAEVPETEALPSETEQISESESTEEQQPETMTETTEVTESETQEPASEKEAEEIQPETEPQPTETEEVQETKETQEIKEQTEKQTKEVSDDSQKEQKA